MRIVEYNLQTELQHGNYVSRLAGAIAGEMHAPPTLIRDVRIAGLLHDIGKLRLTRYMDGSHRDPLLIEEMKYVRLHSNFSYEIVKEAGYSDNIQEIVRRHHENADGTGYPDGLSGEEIPVGARIIRVSDVFAALTTDRPYRSGFPVKTAMELMIEEIPHFDMGVFLAFQNVVHRVGASYYEELDPALLAMLDRYDDGTPREKIMLDVIADAIGEEKGF